MIYTVMVLIVLLLVIMKNNNRCTVQRIEIRCSCWHLINYVYIYIYIYKPAGHYNHRAWLGGGTEIGKLFSVSLCLWILDWLHILISSKLF